MKKHSLKEEIGKITKRLIQFYKPQKIVIFGSSATGKKTGDIDMLIVKKTRESFFKRMSTKDGRAVLKRRRDKGRKKLSK